MVMGPPDTLYEGGMFKAELKFPKEYPSLPPKLTFTSEIWHPNGKGSLVSGTQPDGSFSPSDVALTTFLVYKSGDVCISILHAPGEDKYGYESAAERWLPVHTVTTIMLSVISMLADPNDESPANLEAAVWTFAFTSLFSQRKPIISLTRLTCPLQKEWREDKAKFKKRVQRCVRKSQEEL